MVTTFEELVDVDRHVAERDPLGADGYFRMFPKWNDLGDLDAIVREASVLVRKLCLEGMELADLTAVKRDLAMIAAAILRHRKTTNGPNPLGLVPGLESCLLEVAAEICENPSLSTYDYCTRNPEGARERRFTERLSEGRFIDSVRQSIWCQFRTLNSLAAAHGMSLADPYYATLLANAGVHFAPVVEIMVRIRTTISAEEFSRYIRPFFDQMLIGGQPWHTASAAHSAMVEIDQLVWSASSFDFRVHEELCISYQPKALRILAGARAKESLVGAAVSEVARGIDLRPSSTARNSLKALERLLLLMRRFRFPHFVTVKDNTDWRREHEMGTKGSAGEDEEQVYKLRAATDDNWKTVRHLLEAAE